MTAHSAIAAAISAITMKIMCQLAKIITTCPIDGATTGITMNTMKISDITSAMARPPKRSRTIETAMTRVEAAPMPWMKRSASKVSKVGAKTAPAAAQM